MTHSLVGNPHPPVGTRQSFLFTDIVDSSRMAAAFGHTAYVEQLQAKHDAMLGAAIALCSGYVDGTAGDSFFVAFETAEGAVNCAREIQQRLHEAPLTATATDGETRMRTEPVRRTAVLSRQAFLTRGSQACWDRR